MLIWKGRGKAYSMRLEHFLRPFTLPRPPQRPLMALSPSSSSKSLQESTGESSGDGEVAVSVDQNGNTLPRKRKGLSSKSLISPSLPSITLSESVEGLTKSPSGVVLAWSMELDAPPPVALAETFTWQEFAQEIAMFLAITAAFCLVVSFLTIKFTHIHVEIFT